MLLIDSWSAESFISPCGALRERERVLECEQHFQLMPYFLIALAACAGSHVVIDPATFLGSVACGLERIPRVCCRRQVSLRSCPQEHHGHSQSNCDLRTIQAQDLWELGETCTTPSTTTRTRKHDHARAPKYAPIERKRPHLYLVEMSQHRVEFSSSS